MKLWHYTGEAHVAGIMREGIRPYRSMARPLVPQHHFVWLTENTDWSQPWATMIDHDCDRSAVRLRVHLDAADPLLGRYVDTRDRWPAQVVAMLEADPAWVADAPNWWLYGGTIAPSRIKHTERRPALAAAE